MRIRKIAYKKPINGLLFRITFIGMHIKLF